MVSQPWVAPREAAELEGEYLFVREIGRGGTGVVYLATDRELGRPVAIKLIQSSLVSDEETLQRFTREARTASMLHHPNIVAVHAVKRLRNGTLAMVLQYVPGGTLKDLIRREAPLPVALVERLLLDIASALAYAHRRGIVHRDVKPENIFLDASSGAALLADFGIARTPDASANHTLSGVAIGTPAYMAPEQIDGEQLDGRADLYSLALVGWEMLTGETPWEGESLYSIIHKQKYEELPPLHSYRDDVPLHLWHGITTGLRKDPQQRFADAHAFVAALEAGNSGKPWRRWIHWLAARRVRRVAPLPAPPPPPEVRLEATDAFAFPVEADTDATLRFRRPSDAGVGGENGGGSAVQPPAADPSPAEATRAEPLRARVQRGETALPLASWLRAPSLHTARALRYTAAAAGLLLLTGLGATLYAITQRTPEAALQAGTSSAPDAPSTGGGSAPVAGGGSGVPGFAETPTLPGGTSRADLWQSAEIGVNSPIRLGVPMAAPRLEAPAPASEHSADTPQPRPDSAAPSASTPVTTDAAPETTAAEAPATALRSVRTIAAGGLHTCLMTTAGEVSCWGGNGEGQAGSGGMARVVSASRIGSGVRFREVTAGVAHTCGILASGEAACWGSNRSGQLGDGSTAGRREPVIVTGNRRFGSIHAGRSHTCGIARNGELFCWGDNERGQLGNGSTRSSTIPVRSAPGQFRQAAVGWSHTCALDRRGQAFCWGANADGQLGADDAGESATPLRVPVPARLLQVVAGAAHSCALTQGGSAFCWGRNTNGQLGTGSTVTQRTPAKVAGEVSFVALSAGSTHTCGLTRGGEAFCWGRNSYGQLGDGSTTDRLVPTRVEASARFSTLHASGAHTCALTAAGEHFCWGYNVEGQLGDGTRDHRSRPVRITPVAD